MSVKVLMISRDASGVHPSDTRERFRLLTQADVDLTVVVAASAKTETYQEQQLTVQTFGRWLPVVALRLWWWGMVHGASFDLLTVQDPFEFALLASFLSWWHGKPLEVQVHGDFFGAWHHQSFSRRLRLIGARWVLSHADQIRCVSERVATSLHAHLPKEKKIVILPVATPTIDARSVLETKRSDLESSPVLFYAGRFAPEKRLDILFAAFDIVKKEIPAATLVLRGSGELQSWVETEAKKREGVIVLPWTNDETFVQCSVAVLTSDHESWNRFVIMAAQRHIPVVMTDVGCAGEVLVHQESALIVPVGDIDAIATAIIDTIKNQEAATRRAEKAFEAVSTLLNQEETAKRQVEMWKKMLT